MTAPTLERLPKVKFYRARVKNYGFVCVNRLALIDAEFEKMTENERRATLNWINSKYGEIR